MNLALLDPFRRQIPDRIDSTLTIPRALHPPRPKKSGKLDNTEEGGGPTGGGQGALNGKGGSQDEEGPTTPNKPGRIPKKKKLTTTTPITPKSSEKKGKNKKDKLDAPSEKEPKVKRKVGRPKSSEKAKKDDNDGKHKRVSKGDKGSKASTKSKSGKDKKDKKSNKLFKQSIKLKSKKKTEEDGDDRMDEENEDDQQQKDDNLANDSDEGGGNSDVETSKKKTRKKKRTRAEREEDNEEGDDDVGMEDERKATKRRLSKRDGELSKNQEKIPSDAPDSVQIKENKENANDEVDSEGKIKSEREESKENKNVKIEDADETIKNEVKLKQEDSTNETDKLSKSVDATETKDTKAIKEEDGSDDDHQNDKSDNDSDDDIEKEAQEQEESDDDDAMEAYWTACYTVSFNRRGTYLATGHASGLIPCHEFMSRTVSALYRPPPGVVLDTDKQNVSLVATVGDDRDSSVEGGVGSAAGGVGDGSTGAGSAGVDASGMQSGETDSGKKKRGRKSKKVKEEELKLKQGSVQLSPVTSSEKEGKGDGHTKEDKETDKINNKNDENIDTVNDETNEGKEGKNTTQLQYLNGVTSLSWDRRSRTLLSGAIGDRNLRLIDNTHPVVAVDCVEAVRRQWLLSEGGGNGKDKDSKDEGVDGKAFGTLETPDGKGHHRESLNLMSPLVPALLVSTSPKKEPPNNPKNQPNQILQPAKKSGTGSQDSTLEGGKFNAVIETVSYGKVRLLRSNVLSFDNKSTSPFQTEHARSTSQPSQSIQSSETTPRSSQCLLQIQAKFPPPQSRPQTVKGKNKKKGVVVPTVIKVPAMRHPTLVLELPRPLGGPVQLHPRTNTNNRNGFSGYYGLACMIDGSLALFWIPQLAFYETLPSMVNKVGNDPNIKDADLAQMKESLERDEANRAGNVAYLIPPPDSEEQTSPTQPEKPLSEPSSNQPHYFVTCAAFGKNGHVLYAVTKCGTLLGFEIEQYMLEALRGECFDGSSPSGTNATTKLLSQNFSTIKPSVCVKVPGGAAAWQIIVSRNGKNILINSADCALRLYDAEELGQAFGKQTPSSSDVTQNQPKQNEEPEFAPIKPRFVFQDLVSKAPWASCDFSGDGEYVVGGCNSYPQPGDNYQLFLWNTITGELMDQLTGPQVSLYSLSCHPTRPYIAVGTSDGLVDIWGPRMDWTAFAPDFQALQQNVLYVEREDEFDVVVDMESEDQGVGSSSEKNLSKNKQEEEDEPIDIKTVVKVPAFESDSEDEKQVFHFDVRVMKILSDKPGRKGDQE